MRKVGVQRAASGTGTAEGAVWGGAPKLGLVCITMDERYRFRTVTLARLKVMTEGERERVLTEIYWHNVQKLESILGYCDRVGIRLYRISSAVFPMSDLPEGERALFSMRNVMGGVGRRAGRLGIRMVIHPDQFVVLNSPREEVRRTSRMILEKHGRNLDWLGLERSQWAAMNIHGGYSGIGLGGVGGVKVVGAGSGRVGEVVEGGGGIVGDTRTLRRADGKSASEAPGTKKVKRTKEEQAAAREAKALAREAKAAALVAERGVRKRELMDVLCGEVETLPPEVRSRLTFENDEHGYSAGEIFEICQRTGAAMVFDNLHHAVHEGIGDYDEASFGEWVGKARATWERPQWQMVHLSNGANGPVDRYHSGFIVKVPQAYRGVEWIEVEARGKEGAIFHLREAWGLSEEARAARVPGNGVGEVGCGTEGEG